MIRQSIRMLKHSPTLAINEMVTAMRTSNQDCIHLGFGQSPFPVHPLIAEALSQHNDKNMYLPCAGLPDLRDAALTYWSSYAGFNASNCTCIIGPGSKELLFDAQYAIDGDLLLPTPSWVSYAPQAAMLGDDIIAVPADQDHQFTILPEALERAIQVARKAGKNPRKLILNYPNNPSGVSLSALALRDIARVCRQHNIIVISDEIYGKVTFSGEHLSIAHYYPEGTIITGGLSKHLSLGGYRIGFAIIPNQLNDVTEAMVGIASETFSSVSSPIQYASLQAFSHSPDLEDYIRECTNIYHWLAQAARMCLNQAGINYPEPEGGFYLFPDFTPYAAALQQTYQISGSEDLARCLLKEAGVATLPGSGFGDDPKHLTLRLANCDFDGQQALDCFRNRDYADPCAFMQDATPRLWEAYQRIQQFLNNLQYSDSPQPVQTAQL